MNETIICKKKQTFICDKLIIRETSAIEMKNVPQTFGYSC